jgi:signal transduction histidine kinase
MRLPTFEKMTLGYRFDKEREIVSLVLLSYFYILLFSAIVILLYTIGEEFVPFTYRYHSMVLFGCLELVLVRIRLIKLAKILILTVTPFILLILPPLAGITSDEFYFWFPYVPIALSLIPHFILHTSRDRVALILTLVAYLLLALFIPGYMIHFKNGTEKIIPIVMENRFYYSFVPIIIYIFVNLALGLVFARNYRYEQIMISQQDELIQAEKMASLGTLITGIAHEINNPLNFISGGLHALNTLRNEYLKLEGEVSPEKEALIGQMNKIMDNSLEGVHRASEIITSLRFFANPGQMVKSEHDLESLLYKVMLSIEQSIPYNIKISKEIPPGIKVHCYEEQFQQVLVNILLNAFEAIEEMDDKGQRKVIISARETSRDKKNVTCISIRNNGPSIPEESIRNIYDPFFTLKDSGKGKGLGMAISYMIMREHKGWIEARNENEWVVFDVLLPIR